MDDLRGHERLSALAGRRRKPYQSFSDLLATALAGTYGDKRMVNVKKPEENTGRDRERDKTLSGVLGTTSLVCLALAALLPARESSRLFHVWLPLGLSILAVLALYLSFVYALLVRGSLQLDGNGSELIISNTKGTAYVIGLEGAEQSPPASAVPYDYAANGSLPVLSPDGSTVLVPTVGGGWKLGSVGALLAPVNPVTPPDSHWPKENGSVLFSSDSSVTDNPVILTFPDNGDIYDLWNESTQTLMQNFTIPGTESPDALFLGAGGRQLVLGAGTAGDSEYTELSVYNTPLG